MCSRCLRTVPGASHRAAPISASSVPRRRARGLQLSARQGGRSRGGLALREEHRRRDAVLRAVLGGARAPGERPAADEDRGRGTGTVAFTVPYGLGLDIRHMPCGVAYGHEGDMPGYRNAVWASADGRRVAAVMVNVESRRLTWDAIRLAATAA